MAESFREVEPESFESSWASENGPPRASSSDRGASASRRISPAAYHASQGMADDLDVSTDIEDGGVEDSPHPVTHHHPYRQHTSSDTGIGNIAATPVTTHTSSDYYNGGVSTTTTNYNAPTSPPPPPPAATSNSMASSPTFVGSPLGSGSGASQSTLTSANTSYANTSFSGSSGAPMKFRKGKLLGQGAYGAVFQAMNVMSGELLAIKQIPIAADTSSSALRDIEREIAINSALPSHNHCVQYRGIQSTSRNIYIIMEHVSGGSIQSLLKSVGRFHENTMRRYAHMTLIGLQHLHRHNVVHQDIKGANVLIDERGIAKIADFGCSRDLSKTTSSASMVGGGTPLWMAPEVCRGEYASKQSDIWSFGCLLLEMTSAEQVPWVFAKGTSAFAVLYAIGAATRPPKPPSHLSPTAMDFLSTCLQIDRARRPTVDELLRHPFLHQDGETVGGCEEWGNFDDEDDEVANTNSDDDMFERSRSGAKPRPKQKQQKQGGNAASSSGGFVLRAVENSPDRRVGGGGGGGGPSSAVSGSSAPASSSSPLQVRLNPPPRQAPTSSVTGDLKQDLLHTGFGEEDPYRNGTVWQSGGSEHVGIGDELYNIEELDGNQQKKRKKGTSLKGDGGEGTARKLAQKFSCLLSPK